MLAVGAHSAGSWGVFVARSDVRLSVLARQYVRTRADRRELRAATARGLRYDLDHFCRAIGDPPARGLKRDHIERWRAEQRCADSTLRTRWSRVHGFVTWLVIHGHLRADPFVGMPSPKVPESQPRALNRDEVARVLAACPDERARLIVTLEVQEGLRAGEVARLTLGGIDEVNRTILVHGKGGHQRTLPITAATARALRAYLDEWRPMGDGPLIRSQVNPYAGLSPGYISTYVSRLFSAAGVKRYAWDGKSGHAFRHTAISDVVEATGGNVVVGREMAGHRSISVTQRYLRRVTIERLREAMEGRDYRSGKEARGDA